jgi:Rod binding domain-containing protein
MQSAPISSPITHAASKRVGFIPDNRPLTEHQKLLQQTRKWVALSFFEPMLKEMRQSPFHSNLFDGGSAGKTFESMYDQNLAQKMASDSTDPLVQSIVSKIEGSRAYAQHAAAARRKSTVNSEREGADRVRAQNASSRAENVASYF